MQIQVMIKYMAKKIMLKPGSSYLTRVTYNLLASYLPGRQENPLPDGC